MERKKRAVWLVPAAALTAVDLWSKGLWEYPNTPDGRPVLEKIVIEDWLYIRTIWNTGGVWSAKIPQPVLFWVTLLAVPLLAAWLFVPKRSTKWESCGKALVLGGAAGNLWDRFWYEGVRDFIDVAFGDVKGWHWPTFNVADIALVVGIGMLLLVGILPGTRHEEEAR